MVKNTIKINELVKKIESWIIVKDIRKNRQERGNYQKIKSKTYEIKNINANLQSLCL